jgi:hypothetical protein
MMLWCMLAPRGASAEQFTEKVVAIADGDTIPVRSTGKAVKSDCMAWMLPSRHDR